MGGNEKSREKKRKKWHGFEHAILSFREQKSFFFDYLGYISGYTSGSMWNQSKQAFTNPSTAQVSIDFRHDVSLTRVTFDAAESLLKKPRGAPWLIHIYVDNDLGGRGFRSIAPGPFNASREGCSESS